MANLDDLKILLERIEKKLPDPRQVSQNEKINRSRPGGNGEIPSGSKLQDASNVLSKFERILGGNFSKFFNDFNKFFIQLTNALKGLNLGHIKGVLADLIKNDIIKASTKFKDKGAGNSFVERLNKRKLRLNAVARNKIVNKAVSPLGLDSHGHIVDAHGRLVDNAGNVRGTAKTKGRRLWEATKQIGKNLAIPFKAIYQAGKDLNKADLNGKPGDNIYNKARGGIGRALGQVGGEALGLGAAAGENIVGALAPIAEFAALNPYTAIAAAVVGLVAAIPAFVIGVKHFAGSWLESQKYLAAFSGSMAAVFGNKEIRETYRNIRIGEATSASAGKLNDSYQNLLDALAPYVVSITNILNDILAFLADIASWIAKIGSFLLPKGPAAKNDDNISKFIRDWSAAADRVQGRPRFQQRELPQIRLPNPI